MIEQLKNERENFEKEKSESKNMVNMLEARLKQMTSVNIAFDFIDLLFLFIIFFVLIKYNN